MASTTVESTGETEQSSVTKLCGPMPIIPMIGSISAIVGIAGIPGRGVPCIMDSIIGLIIMPIIGPTGNSG